MSKIFFSSYITNPFLILLSETSSDIKRFCSLCGNGVIIVFVTQPVSKSNELIFLLYIFIITSQTKKKISRKSIIKTSPHVVGSVVATITFFVLVSGGNMKDCLNVRSATTTLSG